MHTLKGKAHEIPLWLVDYSIDYLVDKILYRSTNKIPYSSINWVDRDTIEINTLGGKGFFYFCSNFFVITDIIFTCEKQQIFVLHSLDISCTHAHEVHF